MKTIFYTLILCFFSYGVYAQKTITGKAVDLETSDPLIGANVYLTSNSGVGTTTDFDGNFSLEVSPGDELTISYTGYTSQTFIVDDRDYYEIVLSSGTTLEELVVIGYGEIKKEDATGAVQSVSTKDFNQGAITSPAELLAGKVAGVNISTSGDPGGGSSITIRGLSTLAGGNDPLIVIDGVPIDGGGASGARNKLNLLNPNDIETFTVLKDASAAAIYGNRASGGVILITTKRASVGQPLQLSYTGNISTGQVTETVEVLDADQYRTTIAEVYEEDHPARALMGSASTDWQKEIYQSAFGTDHNLVAAGSAKSLPYRLSLGYTDKNGILKTDKFQRFSGGLNLNPRLLDNYLQINLSAKTALIKNRFADRGAIGNSMRMDPTQPINSESSDYFGYFTWLDPSGNGLPNSLAPVNPMALLDLVDDKSDVTNYILSGNVDYRFSFFPALRANLNLGYDASRGEGKRIVPAGTSFTKNQGGSTSTYDSKRTNRLLETYLNYKEEFGVHDVDAMFGYSWQHFYEESNSENMDVTETRLDQFAQEYYLLSLFGRFNYQYNDRYLFTATLRQDNTSKYAKEYRTGYFPSFAFAAKIIENDNARFNNLKLRLGWGTTGNQNGAAYYGYLPRYQYGETNAAYQFGNEYVNTIRPNGYIGNIKWEETTTINAGLDISIIKDRLFTSLDYYQRETEDMLNYIPLPALSNLTNFATTNIGAMESNGFEMAITSTPVQTEKINWDLSFNMAYNKAKITNLIQGDDPNYNGVEFGGIAGGVGSTIQIHSVGYQPSMYYVYEQLYDDNGNLLEGQFVDQNNDGNIDSEDKIRYHSSMPDWTMGVSSGLNAGNFDFSFAGRANLGQYAYHNVWTDQGYLNRLYGTTGYLSNVTSSAVDLNVYEQSNLTFSNHFVEKASFFRMDHITAGYRFVDTFVKSLRVFGTIQNAFVISNYTGIDPEVAIDNNVYPRPRTFVFGVNVQF